VKHVPLNVVNIHIANIARNVLKHVKNVLKNAGKWPLDKIKEVGIYLLPFLIFKICVLYPFLL
jgi:hypothetical protein